MPERALSKLDRALRHESEGRQSVRPSGIEDHDMPQYLVAIHHPENYDPSLEDDAMIRDIGQLNEAMKAAGARFFAGGLESPGKARSLRKQSDGKVVVTDGPYIESKEHIGGFWILEAADMDAALAWGRKAVVACRAPVEVRAFLRHS
ncbi:YciI family protein [Dyella kyungheensis]